jgi:hypothetical protein
MYRRTALKCLILNFIIVMEKLLLNFYLIILYLEIDLLFFVQFFSTINIVLKSKYQKFHSLFIITYS